MLHVLVIPVTPFEQNCSLLWCDRTGEAAVIDPGGDLERIEEAIRTRNLNVRQILLTHGHIDHAAGPGTCPAPGWHTHPRAARRRTFLAAGAAGAGAYLRFRQGRSLPARSLARRGRHGIHRRTHAGSPPRPRPHAGARGLLRARRAARLRGDVLFAGSIGRTDFPRGDHRQLISGILAKLLPLGDDVRFVPGHGPMSTFGEERLNNPFLV